MKKNESVKSKNILFELKIAIRLGLNDHEIRDNLTPKPAIIYNITSFLNQWAFTAF